MNKINREALKNQLLFLLMGGVGGHENFDKVLIYALANPDKAKEWGKSIFEKVAADKKEPLSVDEAFEADMNRRGDAQEDFIPGSMVSRGNSY